MNRVTSASYNCCDEQNIREHHYFYTRAYRAVSKHHPNGEIAKDLLLSLDECRYDYKMLGTLGGAVQGVLKNLGGIFNGYNNN
jgi:hypothetical protein